MTTVFNDNVQTTMMIGGNEWLVAEAEVVLSQVDTPNYVDINRMIPGEGVEVPSPPSELISENFRLEADNDLISERATDAEEDTLLFDGKLANISAIGTRAYEGIAYDPSQQPVAKPGDEFGGNGSVLNQQIFVKSPYYGVSLLYGRSSGMKYERKTTKGAKLAKKVVDEIPGVDDYEIQLTEGGVTRTGPNGSVTGAYNRELKFDSVKISLQEAITDIREKCECEWWFDKEGKLYFGLPESTAHELRFITDGSDGITTPPYQSVRVIGSGVASKDGYGKKQLVAEDRIEVNATFRETKGNEFEPIFGKDVSGLPEPKFTYRNAEISTRAQAKSTAKKIVKDLAKQSAKGKVSVVGFAEVTPFDAIIMPHASEEKRDAGVPNYQPGMPMGGNRYGVYKVVHKLNGSDGFKTEITVCGLTGTSRIVVPVPGNQKFLVNRGDWAEMRASTR